MQAPVQTMLIGLNSDSFLLETQLTGQRPGLLRVLSKTSPPPASPAQQGTRLHVKGLLPSPPRVSIPSSVQLGLDRTTQFQGHLHFSLQNQHQDEVSPSPAAGSMGAGPPHENSDLCRPESPQESRAWLLTPNPGHPGLRLVPTFQNFLDT